MGEAGPPSRGARGVAMATWGMIAVSGPLDQLLFPESAERWTPVSILAGLAALLGHMIWVSMDCHRRGRPVGAWRYFTFFAAPLAVSLYLVAAYRRRGVLLALAYLLGLAGAWLAAVAGAYGVWLVQSR